MAFYVTTEYIPVHRRPGQHWEQIAQSRVEDEEAEQALVGAASACVVTDDERTGGQGDLYEYRITVTYDREDN